MCVYVCVCVCVYTYQIREALSTAITKIKTLMFCLGKLMAMR